MLDDLPCKFIEIDPGPSDNEPDAATPNGLPTLPVDFWEARESLKALRDWARANWAAPDALLGNALARASIESHNDTRIFSLGEHNDPTHAGLFSAVVAQSGGGKTTAAKASRRLFWDVAEDARSDVVLGSGEGLSEAFIEEIEIPPPLDSPPKTKPTRERRQTKRRVHFMCDEGEGLVKLLGRESATLGPTLRSAFTGDPIGNANADQARTRRVVDYTLSLTLNATPGVASAIAAHAETGLPQRLLWFSGLDPEVPRHPKRCDKPSLPPLPPRIDFAESIIDELNERRWLIQRGSLEIPPMNEHLPLIQCRVAAILCGWEDRANVTNRDWELAGILIDTSCRVRDMALEQAREQAADERSRRAVERAEAGQIMKLRCGRAEHDCERVASILARRVHRQGKAKARDLQQCVKSTDRHLFREGLEFAMEATWIAEHDGGFVPGVLMPVQ